MSSETTDFDAYYVLLGIPPRDQPPNYYRLLGLEQFESNADIISMAAERQMGYLVPHESGDHIDEVARLASEVSRARLCLLNPKKKKEYDESLAAEIENQTEPRSKNEVSGDEEDFTDLQLADLTATEIESAPLLPRLAPLSPALQSKAVVASPVQAEKHPAGNSQEPWSKRHLWIAVAGGAAALVLFIVVLAAIVIVIARQGADRESAESVEEDLFPQAEAADLQADEEEDNPETDDVTDDPLTGDTAEEIDEADREVKAVEIAHVEPEAPLEGETVSVRLPADTPEDVSIEYRLAPSSSWSTIRRTSGTYGISRPQGAAASPSFTVSNVEAGTLRIDVRATSIAGQTSPITTNEIEVADNPWLDWQEAGRIKHSLAIEQLTFSPDGERMLVASRQKPSSTRSAAGNAVTQLTTWNTLELSSLDDLSTLDTLAAMVRDDGSLVWVREVSDSSSTEAASEPRAISTPFEALASKTPTPAAYNLYAVNGKRQILLSSSPTPATRVAFSADGRDVAMGFADYAAVWKIVADRWSSGDGKWKEKINKASVPVGATGGRPASAADAPQPAVTALPPLFQLPSQPDAPLLFSPDGSLVCRGGANVDIWRIKQQDRLRSLATPASCLAFTQDGKRLATSFNGEIKIWAVATGELDSTIQYQADNRSNLRALGQPRRRPPSSDARVEQLCFHPDGNELAAAVSDQIIIFRIADGRRMRTFTGHSGTISSVAFSPDGSILATGGAGRTVRLQRAHADSPTKTATADPPVSGTILRVDQFINSGEFTRALDAMQLPAHQTVGATFSDMQTNGQYMQLHAALAGMKGDSMEPDIRKRFDSIRLRLEEKHRQLALEAIRDAGKAKDEELANYKVCTTFPAKLIPPNFLEEQLELHRRRKKAALAHWERAKTLMNRKKADKPTARTLLLKIVAMEEYFPNEAKIARAKMQELGLDK